MVYCCFPCSTRSALRAWCGLWLWAFAVVLMGGMAAGAERRLPESLPPGSDELPVDETFQWGQLANGLRYVLRQHSEPDNQVAIRLLVHAGSMEELEIEQGLAHYLEHLAFKGSDTFPDNSFVSTMQSAGISHGSHSNAHTGFDETVYKLDVPADNPALLRNSLLWMRDVLSSLHLLEPEVESEKGVILAEMRDRDSVGLRAAKRHFEARYPGMTLSQRWPIGLEETVRAANAQRLRDYWTAWYRSDNAVLSVVGDLPIAELEALVTEIFADLPAAQRPLRSKPSRGALKPHGEVVISQHQEDEITATVLRFYVVSDPPFPGISWAHWQEQARASLGSQIISRRLSELAEEPGAPILGGSGGAWWWHDLLHGALSVQVREQAAEDAIKLVITELRRFNTYGPTDDELALAIADQRARLRQAIATADNRSSSQLATAAYQAVKDNDNLLSPEQSLALWERLFADLRAEQVRQAFARAFSPEESLEESPESPAEVRRSLELNTAVAFAEADLRSAYEAAMSAEVSAPVAQASSPWPYALAPAALPAVDAQRVVLADGGTLHSFQFANGVVGHVLPRSDKAQELLLSLRIAHRPGAVDSALRALAERSFLQRGTAQLSQSALRRQLAGSTVRLNVSINDEAVVLSGSCLPDEVERWLSYAQALISDPGWRMERVEEQRMSWLAALRAEATDLEAQVRARFVSLVTGDARDRRLPSPAEVEALEATAVRQWLEPILADGSMEFAAVGDVQAETIQAALGRTLATLAPRPLPEQRADLAADGAMLPAAALPSGEVRMTVNGAVPRAQILIAWPGQDMSDIRGVRRMGQLAAALRVRLREELRSAMGEAYSPSAGHMGSDLWRDHAYLQAVVSVAPDLADVARDAVLRAAQGLATDGISDELFAEVQRPALTNLPIWRADNRYWLGQVAARAWSQPQRLDWSGHMLADFSAITAAELSALAAEVFSHQPLILIGVSPENN